MYCVQVDRRINLTGQIARAYGDADASFMTITDIRQGSVEFSWTNNSLRTEPPCPQRQIAELSDRLITPGTGGRINPDFRRAMRPYQLVEARVTLLGACSDAAPPAPGTSASPTAAEDGRGSGPVVSGRVVDSDDQLLLLIVVVAVSLMAVMLLVLVIIICVCCCRRSRRLRAEKQRRAAADELSCANKGIPVIFADELLDNDDNNDDGDDDTPASTLKLRQRGDDDTELTRAPPPPDYPTSRTSTLRSDYKAGLISSDDDNNDDDNDDEQRQLVNNDDTLPGYRSHNDNNLS